MATEQVAKAKPIPFTVTLKSSKSAVSAGAQVTLSGTVLDAVAKQRQEGHHPEQKGNDGSPSPP